MAVAMDVAKAVPLDDGPDSSDEDRRNHDRGPKSDATADFKAEVGPKHIEAGVSDVENIHHTKDERKPARHHEQQHAVEDAVEQRENDQLQHGVFLGSGRSGAHGRCILHVVGTNVSCLSTLATSFQPHPVCSSSNLSLGPSGPKTEM